MKLRLRSDDRLLFLAMPPVTELAGMARVLMNGVIVVLADEAEAPNARSALAEFDNIIVVDAGPDAIPWREHYFSKVIVPPELERAFTQLSPEIERVLARDGEVLRAATDA